MFKHRVKEQANNALDKAQGMAEDAKQSSEDWLDYIMDHPLQSLIFGAVIGLAIRGFLKK